MWMRRIATVTTSAPLAACAACITSSDGYFPVPTNSRERNSYLPIRSVCSAPSVSMLTSRDRDDDFEAVAVAQRRLRVAPARHDLVVERDRGAVAPHAP